MAKKKKPSKGRDSRGYGQHQPPQPSKPSNNKTAPIVSSQTHDGLKNLLGKLQVRSNEEQLQQKSSQSAESSDRFVTKLTSIVHRLQEFGFSDPQMEQVACALGYDMALDTCLDWLCLHLPTLELPSLFTDGRVRSSLMMTTEEGSSLTVLKLVAPPPDSSSGQPESDKSPTDKNGMLSNTNSKNDREEEAAVAAAAEAKKQEEAEAAAKQKAWLLQQYQFEEDDEEGEPDSTNGMKEHRKADTTGQPPGDQEATANTIMTPEEEYLAEKESELKELELDLNNEANNYMRSKHETKQLQIQVKKLRQEVIGLRKKIERTKAKQLRQEQEQQMEVEQPAEEEEKEQPAEEEEKELGEEEDYGGGGLFASMIESPAEASSARNASKEKETQDSKPKILDYCISKDWTGTTPQKTLDETCKKQRLPKPKYVKLPSNRGYRLVVTLKKKQAAKEWQATTSDFVKGSSLQDYLAIQALYEMDPSLPLYRMFPSSFRDLWLSWQDQVQQAQNQEQQEQEAVKRERIERLLALIADKNKNSKPSSSNATQVTSAKTAEEESTVVPIVHDNWDDGEDIQDIPITKNNTKKQPSAQGEKCRQNFVRRQATTEYQQMLEIRSALPMASFRQQVLDTVRKHSVTILCAETGAGKTTQCPQYLLEEALLGGFGGVDSVQILCTQPRRVAATSVAERVAEEMCESTIGKMVGYQIRMEAKRSAQTRLLFCTTGIVLRRLQEDSNLKGVTHVIVDEVHERQQQTDVLLIALRQLLRKSRPDLKVILVSFIRTAKILHLCFDNGIAQLFCNLFKSNIPQMSATMDSKLFCSFFEGAPLLSVPGRTFPVSCYHLEDLMDATHHMIEEGSRCARRENRYEEKATLHITKRGGEKRKEVVDLVSQTDVGEVSDLYPGYKMSTRR